MSTAKFNTWQNPDGTENYKCRAWVNFNGTGTVAIRAAGNVSSITDNGVGDYTVNFTNAMPDANYAVVGAGTNSGGHFFVGAEVSTAPTISAYRLQVRDTTTTATADSAWVKVAIFR